MQTWLVYALLGPALFAVVNYIDKYIVERRIQNPHVIPIFSGIWGIILGTIIWVVTGFPILPLADTLYVFAAGSILIFAAILYFKALAKDSTSTIILLFQMTPLITLAFGYVFLQQYINIRQLGGFFLILGSVIVYSIHKEHKQFKLTRSFYLILLVDILYATAALLMNKATGVNKFTDVLSYQSWGMGIGALIISVCFPNIRHAFRDTIKSIQKNTIGILLLDETLYVIAQSISFYAYTLGPIALVNVLEGSQTFYGVIYGFILAYMYPRLFKEEIIHTSLLKRVGVTIAIFTGLWLIY